MDIYQIISHLLDGILYTLLVTVSCSLTGLSIGVLLACAYRLGGRYAKLFYDFYTFIFRSIPVLVLLFLVYFGLPSAGILIPPLLAMVLSLGLVASAYLAEVFRGALEGVDPTELLAAKAIGMTPFQIFRYIEMPQALRFSAPGIVNELTSVIKYTPLAYTVGVPEIMKKAIILTAITLEGIEVYICVGIIYFLIYRIFLIGIHLLERAFRIPTIA